MCRVDALGASRLAVYRADRTIAEVSPRYLGTLLSQVGLSFQRTRTWKASPTPTTKPRARGSSRCARIHRPTGRSSARSGGTGQPASNRRRGLGAAHAPRAHRADHDRRHGTRYVFGAYDVHADRLRVRVRPCRRSRDMLAFMRQIRECYPARRRIHWIQDNLPRI